MFLSTKNINFIVFSLIVAGFLPPFGLVEITLVSENAYVFLYYVLGYLLYNVSTSLISFYEDFVKLNNFDWLISGLKMVLLRKECFIEIKKVFIILSWSEKGVISFALFFLSKIKLSFSSFFFNSDFMLGFNDYFNLMKFKNLRILGISEFFSLNE